MPRLLYYVFGPIEHGNRVAIGVADVDGVEAVVRLVKDWPKQAKGAKGEAMKFLRMTGTEKLQLLGGGSRFMLGPEASAQAIRDMGFEP